MLSSKLHNERKFLIYLSTGCTARLGAEIMKWEKQAAEWNQRSRYVCVHVCLYVYAFACMQSYLFVYILVSVWV